LQTALNFLRNKEFLQAHVEAVALIGASDFRRRGSEQGVSGSAVLLGAGGRPPRISWNAI